MKRIVNIHKILLTAVTLSLAPLVSAQAAPPVEIELNSAPVPSQYRAVFDPLYPDFGTAIEASAETPYPFLISAAMTESLCERFDEKFLAALEQLLFYGKGPLFTGKLQILKSLSAELYGNKYLKNIMHERTLQHGLAMSDNKGNILVGNFAAAVVLTNALASDSELFSQYIKLQQIYAAISSPLAGIRPESIWKLIQTKDIHNILESEQKTRALFDELIFSSEYLQQRERENHFKQSQIFYFMPYRIDRRRELVKKHNLLPAYFDNLAAVMEHEEPFGPDKAGSLNSILTYAFRNLIGFGNSSNNCSISMDLLYQGRLLGMQKRKYRKHHVSKEESLPLGGEKYLEPLPQYYLQRARGYALLEQTLEQNLDLKQLHSLRISGKGKPEPAFVQLQRMRSLMYGLYIVASEQVGLEPRLDRFTVSEQTIFKQTALKWIRENGPAELADYDVRDIVSIAEFESGFKRYRAYLCTFGLGLDLVEIVTVDGDGAGRSAVYIALSPRRDTLLIRDKIRPYSRDQFKKLCDKYSSRDAIISALVSGGSGPAARIILRLLTGLMLIAGAVVFFVLHGKRAA